ncbi:unnamed protein product [Ambrosiozyma monospora]|uniref:Unnamed protein product n=1 Tax=Ambrosiozyma monospora TaxID=43982 RepID=A0ACB5SVI8_AMBMO|nr:unnamed protein product [Ambrosiozyma monospora]
MVYRKSANVFTDARVNLIKELLKNFKMIKFYSWEDFYREKIAYNRAKEMSIIFRMQSVRNIITSIGVSLSTVSSMVAFCVLWKVDSGRSIGDIFSSLTLYQVLSQQFMMVPMALAMATDMTVGLRRVCAFMAQEEIGLEGESAETLADSSLAIEVDHAEFHWKTFLLEDEEKNDDLKISKTKSTVNNEREEDLTKDQFKGLLDVNFQLSKGEFVVVTGAIGSGKSSLLNALAGFMHKEPGGHVKVNGSLLLCGYPWVQNATIKDNITFGSPFDSRKYNEIIEACSLINDFKQLPGGDMTEVGERGITLSGGQKARINLARAVYADKDIILLDDVLSAVDAKVGKHIMDSCICGYLKDKTRVLATHQLSLIGSADRIIFLNGDGTLDIGTLAELNKRNDGFVNLMKFSNESAKNQDEEEDEEFEEEQELKKQLTKVMSTKPKGETKLMQAEERAVNSLDLSVYTAYLKYGSGSLGIVFLPLFLTVCILGTFCQLFTNNWLSFWAEHKFETLTDGQYVGIYIMFAFLMVFFLALEFYLIVYITNRSSKKLNIMAAARLLHAPMSYIDTTPMGHFSFSHSVPSSVS